MINSNQGLKGLPRIALVHEDRHHTQTFSFLFDLQQVLLYKLGNEEQSNVTKYLIRKIELIDEMLLK